MRRSLLVLLTSGSMALGGSASAIPTGIILGVAIQGLAPITLASSGSVGVAGSILTIGAGQVTLATPILVPVTGTSAIGSLTATKISNLAGTFSTGGVTAQTPGEVCGTGPAAGSACNSGGGIGGRMGITGTINIHIVPNIAVIPVNLNVVAIGQGGSTNSPFTIDAAAWTTGTGLVNTGNNTGALTGGAFPLTLVTPTFVLALGNLLPIFATLTFTNTTYVPESSSLLLIGMGAAGILLLGIRRK